MSNKVTLDVAATPQQLKQRVIAAGPQGPGRAKIITESVKPTLKKTQPALSRRGSRSKPTWFPSTELLQPGGTNARVTEVTANINSLRQEHRKQHNLLLTQLYEVACYVRDQPEAFTELRAHEAWEKHEKLLPAADDAENALKHVFRLAAGFNGKVSNDRSSRWTRALGPFFQERLSPAEVLVRLTTEGGTRALASKRKKAARAGTARSSTGTGSKTSRPSRAASGASNSAFDFRRNYHLQHLRNVEMCVIRAFLGGYDGQNDYVAGNLRNLLDSLLRDRLVQLANGAEPAHLYTNISAKALQKMH